MLNKGLVKKIITALIVSSSMVTAVYAGDVSCPAVSEVKGAGKALNAVVRQSEKSYFVLSAQPAFNDSDLGWMLMVQAQANSFDPAFVAGQNDVKAVVMAMSDEPMEMQGLYVCPYMTSTGGTVIAAAQIDQGNIINPLTVKWDSLQIKK